MSESYERRQRESWFGNAIRFGRSSKLDFQKQAKTVVPYDYNIFHAWREGKKVLSGKDMISFDEPRSDGKKLKEFGSGIFVAGSERSLKRIRSGVSSILGEAFTKSELRGKDVLIHYTPDVPKRAAGIMITAHTKKGASIVRIKPKHAPPSEYAADILVHEMVHALRHAEGRFARDIDAEEVETELETLARLPFSKIHSSGYYRLATEDREKKWKLIKKDKLLLTGDLGKVLRGARAKKRVEELKERSELWKARPKILDWKLGVAKPEVHGENIDRYFLVETSGGRQLDIHIYSPTGRSATRRILDYFRKHYGRKIKVWEWRDGKKVLIYNGKRGSGGKSATKKKASKSKTRAKAKARTKKTKRR